MGSQDRTYQRTHPWITFKLNLERAPHDLWLAIGEAMATCRTLQLTALPPAITKRLESVYLVKGVAATTAIEGNTLSEEEVKALLDGKLELSRSKQYLAQEVKNVIDGLAAMDETLASEEGPQVTITPEVVMRANALVLQDLDLEPEIEPGRIRQHSVVVMNYRGAPAEDCAYLLAEMCRWLNEKEFNIGGEERQMYGFFRAVLAHIYIAWIHPFGDGNGRTARLIEYLILTGAGFPSTAAHLLSNHYNQTRTAYYRALSRSSASGGDSLVFARYAARGFADQLAEQGQEVAVHQLRLAWESLIYEQFRAKKGDANRRRREVALAISHRREPVSIAEIRTLTPRIAGMYGNRTKKTVSRDVAALGKLRLTRRTEDDRVVSNSSLVLSFLPRSRGEAEE